MKSGHTYISLDAILEAFRPEPELVFLRTDGGDFVVCYARLGRIETLI